MFFNNYAQLDKLGNVIAEDHGQDFVMSAISEDVEIHVHFLQVITTDGTDYYSTANNFIPLNFTDVTVLGPFPGILLACDNNNNAILPRYNHLYWDPSLSAVFSPSPTDPPSPSSTPSKQKKPVYPIAVGVSLGLVGAAVLVVIALYVFFPPFKSFIKR